MLENNKGGRRKSKIRHTLVCFITTSWYYSVHRSSEAVDEIHLWLKNLSALLTGESFKTFPHQTVIECNLSERIISSHCDRL